jgi:phosphatidylinositol alpha-mannosyltransferase
LKSEGHSVSLLAPEARSGTLAAHFGLTDAELADAGPARGFAFNGSVAHIGLSTKAVAVTQRWLTHGFDVIHVHEPLVPLVGTTALRAGVPLVATFHASASGESLAGPWWHAHAASLRHLSARLAVSQLAAESVANLVGLDVQVIPNGIAIPPCVAPEDDQWRGGSRPTGVFIGRIDEPRKGFAVALGAVAKIRAVYPGFELLVIGPGTHRPCEGVRYLGSLESSARDSVLASADVLIAPNTGQESFGMILIEALAQGMRVAASDLPSFREVLFGDPTETPSVAHVASPTAALGSSSALSGCQLFAPGDPVALSEAVCRVLDVPVQQVSKAARARAQRYSWDVIGPQILTVYRGATSG